MTTFKQIHNKFWQNDFVLGLTAEERYFYIYLITNSMTTQCGIYKLNRRLAELEMGYTAQKIEKYLEKFEEYGKVIVSKTTTEIMLVNWLKHNLKGSKKALELINKEFRDVKDKELLKKLYDYCSRRHCPVKEIFSGIIITAVEVEKVENMEKDLSKAAHEMMEEVDLDVQEEKSLESSSAGDENIVTKEPSEPDLSLFNNLPKGDGILMKTEIDVGSGGKEELVIDECAEDDMEEIWEGTPVAAWSFSVESAAALTVHCTTYNDNPIRNTA